MKKIRLRKRNLKRKETWLKKAVAALCTAALLAGMAQGADSLSVRAAGATDIVVNVKFLGDASYSEDMERAAKAFMAANNLIVKDPSNNSEWTSGASDKEYNDADLSNGAAVVKYSFTVPVDIHKFEYRFDDSDEDRFGWNQITVGGPVVFDYNRYGYFFVSEADLLSSQYLPIGFSPLKPSDPSKQGCVFKGWVTSEGGNQSFDFNQTVASSMTIYASWKEWTLDSKGLLTISSQDGMDDWNVNGTSDERNRVSRAVIESKVTNIPSDAFRNCTGLEEIYLVGGVPQKVGNTAFDGCKFMQDDKRGIFVAPGTVDAYKTAWPGYACYLTDSTPPPDAHDYGTEWGSDADGHWPVCSTCRDEKTADKAAHTKDGGTVTEQPTETKPGVMTYKCSTCAYVMEEEEIPCITPSTDIEKEVKTVGNVPRTDIITSAETLAEAALTDEEYEKAENGAGVTVRVTVKDADNSVSDDDKELINAKLDGYKAGKYLDISMLKKIGADEIQVEKMPNGSVQLVFQVPDNLKNTDPTKVRKFKVIRVHKGTATVLDDMDDNENTVTIETDRFSTYALAYQDVERTDADNNTPDDNNNNNNNNNNPGNNTGGNTNTGNTNTGNTNTGNTNTGNTNTRNTNTGGTNGTGINNTAGGSNTGTTGTTNTGTSNQTRGNALRTGDVAPVGFYTMMALCFLGIMMILERKQQLNGIRLIRRMPRPY